MFDYFTASDTFPCCFEFFAYPSKSFFSDETQRAHKAQGCESSITDRSLAIGLSLSGRYHFLDLVSGDLQHQMAFYTPPSYGIQSFPPFPNYQNMQPYENSSQPYGNSPQFGPSHQTYRQRFRTFKTCSYCGRNGHYASECFQRQREQAQNADSKVMGVLNQQKMGIETETATIHKDVNLPLATSHPEPSFEPSYDSGCRGLPSTAKTSKDAKGFFVPTTIKVK